MKISLLSLVAALAFAAHGQSSYQADVQVGRCPCKGLISCYIGQRQAKTGTGIGSGICFAPDARLISYGKKTSRDNWRYDPLRPMSTCSYSAAEYPQAFYERELHRVTEQFGTITHVFSTYETRESENGPATNRGINSIQLFYDGTPVLHSNHTMVCRKPGLLPFRINI
ncbi:MAG: hypothetical protein KatS3mg032_1649 [Cyclobacteriaceae bacterium]|nr:MAG: hypothetical protein KatS3mg032_1649 [Cyclobacteriaceae bacterium]